MMSLIARNRTGMQIGDNTNLFDWTYIENAAYAHLLAADRLDVAHPKHARVAGEAFFISNDEPRPYWDFPHALWRVAGHTPKKITVIPKPVAMVVACIMELVSWFTGRPALLTRFRVTYVCLTRWCRIDKAKEALDYVPPVSLDEGIRRSAEVCLLLHVATSESSLGFSGGSKHSRSREASLGRCSETISIACKDIIYTAAL